MTNITVNTVSADTGTSVVTVTFVSSALAMAVADAPSRRFGLGFPHLGIPVKPCAISPDVALANIVTFTLLGKNPWLARAFLINTNSFSSKPAVSNCTISVQLLLVEVITIPG